MRKEFTVVGVGKRKAGVGKKSGKSYDFTEISVIYADDDVVGSKAETVAIDAVVIGSRQIAVGDVLDVVYHNAQFKTYVDAIL